MRHDGREQDVGRRSKMLLATTQKSPLRTLAESERESLAAGGPSETSPRAGSDVLVIASQVSQAGSSSLQHLHLRRGDTPATTDRNRDPPLRPVVGADLPDTSSPGTPKVSMTALHLRQACAVWLGSGVAASSASPRISPADFQPADMNSVPQAFRTCRRHADPGRARRITSPVLWRGTPGLYI